MDQINLYQLFNIKFTSMTVKSLRQLRSVLNAKAYSLSYESCKVVEYPLSFKAGALLPSIISISALCTLHSVATALEQITFHKADNIARSVVTRAHSSKNDVEVMQFLISILLCTLSFSGSVLLSRSSMRRSALVMRSIVPDKGIQSAWQLARRSEVKMPCVILVSPFVDGNVGSISRSMLNWGLSELRIGENISAERYRYIWEQ